MRPAAIVTIVLFAACSYDWQTEDNTVRDTDSDEGASADEDTDTDTDTDADTDAATVTDMDTATDTDTGTDTGVENGPVLNLLFMEKILYFRAYEKHRVLVGPSWSIDPDEGDGAVWTEIASLADMKNAMANGTWAKGRVLDLEPWAGETIRLAFHYRGIQADHWYLDDICISTQLNTELPDDCDVFLDDFSGSTVGALPYGWLETAESSDAGAFHWTTTNSHAYSAPKSAFAWSPPFVPVSVYMISTPIELPILPQTLQP